jgi:uncharacterized integral membrane protein (TIGR00697 family)
VGGKKMNMLAISLVFSFAVILFVSAISKKHGPEYLIALFPASLIIAGIVGTKIFQIGPFATSGSVILFSITFLITDILDEFYGKSVALKAVWAGLICYCLAVMTYWISIQIPGASFWAKGEAYTAILGGSSRLIIASLVAYVITQYSDVWIFDFYKKKHGKKNLWVRNNVSTMTSQLVNTIIFTVIAFLGVAPIMKMIVGTYVVKWFIALLDTPMMYLIRGFYAR